MNEIGFNLVGIVVKFYDIYINGNDLEKVIIKEVEGKLNIIERNDFWKFMCEDLLNDRVFLKSLGWVDLIVCDIISICCVIVVDLLKVNCVDLVFIGFVDFYVSFIYNFFFFVVYVLYGIVKFLKRMLFLERL